MLVVNIIAALMGIAAAGACAVLVGLPVGVGKNGMAFSAISDKTKLQTFQKRCRSSEFDVSQQKYDISVSRFWKVWRARRKGSFFHLPGV